MRRKRVTYVWHSTATSDKHETDMSDNLKSLLARTNDILGQGKFFRIFKFFGQRRKDRKKKLSTFFRIMCPLY